MSRWDRAASLWSADRPGQDRTASVPLIQAWVCCHFQLVVFEILLAAHQQSRSYPFRRDGPLEMGLNQGLVQIVISLVSALQLANHKGESRLNFDAQMQ